MNPPTPAELDARFVGRFDRNAASKRTTIETAQRRLAQDEAIRNALTAADKLTDETERAAAVRNALTGAGETHDPDFDFGDPAEIAHAVVRYEQNIRKQREWIGRRQQELAEALLPAVALLEPSEYAAPGGGKPDGGGHGWTWTGYQGDQPTGECGIWCSTQQEAADDARKTGYHPILPSALAANLPQLNINDLPNDPPGPAHYAYRSTAPRILPSDYTLDAPVDDSGAYDPHHFDAILDGHLITGEGGRTWTLRAGLGRDPVQPNRYTQRASELLGALSEDWWNATRRNTEAGGTGIHITAAVQLSGQPVGQVETTLTNEGHTSRQAYLTAVRTLLDLAATLPSGYQDHITLTIHTQDRTTY